MIEINNKQELVDLLASNENVLVDFYASWCGPCRMMMPLLEQMSAEYDNVKFCKVNVDGNAELTVEYDISSIPHVFLMKNGKKVFDFKGAYAKNKLTETLNTYFPKS